MALAISLRFDFEDDKGKSSFTKMRLPTGFSIADYQEFGIAAAQLLVNASTGSVTRASIVFNVSLGGLGLKTVASTVSSVANKLYLQFSTAVTGFLGKTLFPSLIESKVIAGSDDVDEVDTDVAALVSALEDGLTVVGGTMQFTNGRGHDLVTLTEGKEQFRRRSAS